MQDQHTRPRIRINFSDGRWNREIIHPDKYKKFFLTNLTQTSKKSGTHLGDQT